MSRTVGMDGGPSGQAGRPRVLFVDDEKRVLNSMRALFRRDYDLHLTTDGAEAIRIAEDEAVDVIIADQRMPGLSGVEVLGEVRRRVPSAVRILLTGYADLDAIEGSINIGEVFRFLSKPCPPRELRETLAEAVQVARQSAQAARQAARAEAQPPAAHELPAATGAEGSAEPKEPAVPVLTVTAAAAARPVATRSADPSTPEPGESEITVPDLDRKMNGAASDPAQSTTSGPPDPGTIETEIILSGENDIEFIDTIVIGDQAVGQRRAAPRAGMHDVGVALFTDDGAFGEQVQRVLGERYRLTRACTLVEVTELLSEGGAGVMVTDFYGDGSMLRNMISTLKRYLPELVTIVVSDERDAAEMISLINHGQVFRYMSKPMDEGRLAQNVNAAVLRHIQLRENPELVSRHSVVPDRPPREGSALLTQFVERIRGMRRFWTGA